MKWNLSLGLWLRAWCWVRGFPYKACPLKLFGACIVFLGPSSRWQITCLFLWLPYIPARDVVKVDVKRVLWVKVMFGLKVEQSVDISDNYTVVCVHKLVCWAFAKRSSINCSRECGASKGKSSKCHFCLENTGEARCVLMVVMMKWWNVTSGTFKSSRSSLLFHRRKHRGGEKGSDLSKVT